MKWKISEMVNNIQLAFLEEIDNLEWMDEQTRRRSLKKLKAMKKRIGYPEWMNNPEEYDEYYSNVSNVHLKKKYLGLIKHLLPISILL